MEHDRLMEEIVRLRSRIGQISPRGSPCAIKNTAESSNFEHLAISENQKYIPKVKPKLIITLMMLFQHLYQAN